MRHTDLLAAGRISFEKHTEMSYDLSRTLCRDAGGQWPDAVCRTGCVLPLGWGVVHVSAAAGPGTGLTMEPAHDRPLLYPPTTLPTMAASKPVAWQAPMLLPTWDTDLSPQCKLPQLPAQVGPIGGRGEKA